METTDTLLNAEKSLAGAILVDSKCMERISPTLRDTDFQSKFCRTIFQAAKVLTQHRREVDPVTIQEWAGQIGIDINFQDMKHLMDTTSSCENAGEYARIIHEGALRRALQEVAYEAKDDLTTPISELLAKVSEKVNNIGTHVDDDSWVPGDSVAFEEPRWLIEPYVPRGKGTMIQADPGTGKTALVCALAAAVTTGRSALGLKVEAPGNVLMCSTEDDLGVLRGRIEACGGNMRRIIFLKKSGGMTLNAPEIRRKIRQTGAKLLIFDPLQAFLGAGVDLHRANETRPVLAQLFEMCAELDCACVIIAHLGKVSLGKSAVNQSLGSVDIPGAMRSILHIARNPKAAGELIAVHIKSSNAAAGKSIAFSIGKNGGVSFHGFSDLRLEDLSAAKLAMDYENEPMVEVLCSLMAQEPKGGFYSYEDLHQASVKQLGFAPYKSTRELLTRLENPELLRRLQAERSIRLVTRCRSHDARGIRLEPYSCPEGFQQQIGDVAAVASVCNVREKVTQKVTQEERMPWDD